MCANSSCYSHSPSCVVIIHKEFDNLVRRGLLSGKFDYFAREKLYKTADLSEYDLEILKLYGVDTDLKHDSYSPEQLRRIIALPNKSRIRELERLNPIDPSGRKSFGTPEKLLSKESIVKFAELPDKAYETRIPKADELIVDGDIVKEITKDGITNRVIYLRPGQDLSKVGFDKGVTSDEFNAIVHALDYEEQSTVFRALGIVDSDALLSASWVNKGKGNYKVFRGQGYILKVDCDDIHAGLPVDFGSGYKKDYDTLLNEYLFGYERSNVRKYWSDEVKKKFELDEEGYKKFNDRIKNKSFDQIKSEEPETARKIQEIIDDMEVKRRAGGRNYNEWLVSRPEIQGGFFWGKNPNTGKTKTISDVPLFIREYLAEHNLPLIFLGE